MQTDFTLIRYLVAEQVWRSAADCILFRQIRNQVWEQTANALLYQAANHIRNAKPRETDFAEANVVQDVWA